MGQQWPTRHGSHYVVMLTNGGCIRTAELFVLCSKVLPILRPFFTFNPQFLNPAAGKAPSNPF